MTDEAAQYLRWKYGPPYDEMKDHGVEVVALNSKPTVHVVFVRGPEVGYIEKREDGTYNAIALLSNPPESEAELRREGLTRQDAIDFIVGVAEHPLTAEENRTFLVVLNYLADEPEYWSEELKVMARIYNRLNPSNPCEYADRSESAMLGVSPDDDDYDFACGLLGEGHWEVEGHAVAVTDPAWSDRYAPFEKLRDAIASQGELQPEDFTWCEYHEVGHSITLVRTGIHPARTAE